MTKEDAVNVARDVIADLTGCMYSDGESDGFLSRHDHEKLIEMLSTLIAEQEQK